MYENVKDTIVDSSTPNAGRIYDYLIGGHHHFEVDRLAAEKAVEIVPLLPKILKLIRWFLRKAIHVCSEKGFTQFIDFASGLPVEDHIHNNTPQGIKVVYSDIDPVTVQYGRKLIGDNPYVKYETCSAHTPELLLESEAVKTLFGTNHKAAIGFTGICWFLPDEAVDHAMKTFFDWADAGSVVYISDWDSKHISESLKLLMDSYKKMNQPMYLRTREHFSELIKPWQIEDPGFLTFEEWIELSPKITSITEESFVEIGGGTYGGFLRK